MSKSVSLLSALLCTFIWGTTFIAQDTGMDDIGPFTFNAVRFFVGFLAILPLALLFETKKFKLEFKIGFRYFAILSFLIGLSLSYDHRIIDGAEAARFNNDLKENLGKNFAYKLAV